MTGNEYNHLLDGDQCILTEDIDTNCLRWHKGDIIEIVYARQDREDVYVRNLTTKWGERPSYKQLGPLWFLKAMKKYKSWKNGKIVTTFEHKFMPGNTVWYMKDNKPCKDTIFAVHYKILKDEAKWFYTVESESALFQDDGLFATKDELLDSLR